MRSHRYALTTGRGIFLFALVGLFSLMTGPGAGLLEAHVDESVTDALAGNDMGHPQVVDDCEPESGPPGNPPGAGGVEVEPKYERPADCTGPLDDLFAPINGTDPPQFKADAPAQVGGRDCTPDSTNPVCHQTFSPPAEAGCENLNLQCDIGPGFCPDRQSDGDTDCSLIPVLLALNMAPHARLSVVGTPLVRLRQPLPLVIGFPQPVSGLELGDILVMNGYAANLSGESADSYTVDIIPTEIGVVTVEVPAGAPIGPVLDLPDAHAATLELGIPYDDDHNGTIGADEVVSAMLDHFSGLIDREEVIVLYLLHFAADE